METKPNFDIELGVVLGVIGAYPKLAHHYMNSNPTPADLPEDTRRGYLSDMGRYQKREISFEEFRKQVIYLLKPRVLDHIRGSMNARGIGDPDGNQVERAIASKY